MARRIEFMSNRSGLPAQHHIILAACRVVFRGGNRQLTVITGGNGSGIEHSALCHVKITDGHRIALSFRAFFAVIDLINPLGIFKSMDYLPALAGCRHIFNAVDSDLRIGCKSGGFI